MSLVVDEPSATKLPRVLGPLEAFSAVVGSVIGSGIFLVAAAVANNVPFMGGIVLVWVIGGLFSGAGALTLAELGAMLPRAGGLYVFLRAAYGALPAFLFGWVEFLVVRSGSMATLAAAFAQYFAHVVPPPPSVPGKVWQAAAAVLAIAVVTTVNVLGARRGGAVQVIGTALKVGGIAVLIALPFLLGGGSVANLSPVWPTSTANSSIFTGIMAAMVGVLWAYDGWTNVTPLAEEIRDPGRNIPRALILGMAVLIAAYLGMTLAYHYVLPIDEVRSASRDAAHFQSAVAALYCDRLLGWWGVLGISLLVMCSTFIALNGNALSGPRAYFAMARDGLFPAALCRVHPRFQTPANAIISQGILAITLIASGTFLIMVPPTGWEQTLPGWIVGAWATLNRTPLYDLLYTYVIFGAHIFYMLAIASVFVLRVRQPDLPRPYKTLGYPVTPLLFVAAELLLLGDMLYEPQSRVPSLVGLGIVAAGVPAYAYFRRSSAIPMSPGK
jgi:basic amino acid/polyamine antiporter, APA family